MLVWTTCECGRVWGEVLNPYLQPPAIINLGSATHKVTKLSKAFLKPPTCVYLRLPRLPIQGSCHIETKKIERLRLDLHSHTGIQHMAVLDAHILNLSEPWREFGQAAHVWQLHFVSHISSKHGQTGECKEWNIWKNRRVQGKWKEGVAWHLHASTHSLHFWANRRVQGKQFALQVTGKRGMFVDAHEPSPKSGG